MKLYSYFRSSAAFRVRIALNLKGLAPPVESVNLRLGEQSRPEYRAINQAGLVPALVTDKGTLGQSLAIIEWLEETFPEPPLLPQDSWAKAAVRAMACSVACDVHPLNNLRVLNNLKQTAGFSEQQVRQWYHYWIHQGFQPLEQQVQALPFCWGEQPTLADVCLIPQIHNARRYDVDLTPYPKLVSIWNHCQTLTAFSHAMPEHQPDAP